MYFRYESMIELKRMNEVVKNGGVILILMTLIIGVVYTILDLHSIVISGENRIWLRMTGVLLLMCVTYIPYFITQKILNYTKYKSIFFGMWVVFCIGDILIRVDIFIHIINLFDFMGIIFYSMLFTFVFSVGVLFENILRKCKIRNQYCNKISIVVRKKYTTILLKMKKI